MIERAIENWLTNTNERNYQVAFCQVLLQKGHKVIYVSSHRQMEQGKDIITIDTNGDCCAYQLKTGNIDLNGWRKIQGEIKELIELPIIHPSANKTKIHKSFLVTNGKITDEVRLQIGQINEDNLRKRREYSYLDIIEGHALLKEFIDAQGEFIPKELKDFDLFLKLFLEDGTDFLQQDKYFDFFNNVVFKDISRQKSNAINAISSSVVIATYLLNPYQLKKNYYVLFEAWTSLAAYIVRYAQRTGLKEEDWIDSFNLVFSEIVRSLSLLKDETLEREDFLEGNWLGDGGLIYRARATIVVGALTMLEIHLQRRGKDYTENKKLIDLIKNNIPILWFYGESAFPYFFNLIKYLELNGQVPIAQSLLKKLFLSIINDKLQRESSILPSPYYSVNDVLEAFFGFNNERIDFRQFSGTSYILETMMLMMVRRGARDALGENWRKLSHICFKEFKPDNAEDILAWHTDNGTNYSAFPNATQSWAELIREANDFSTVPDLYIKYLDLLRFFILVCPHRANKLIIGLLDQNH